MKLRILLYFTPLIIIMASCDINCQPSSISCTSKINIELLDSLEINVFDTVFNIDAIEIRNESGNIISYNVVENQKTFTFSFVDCDKEYPLGTDYKESFTIKLDSLNIDSLGFHFDVVEGKCGGEEMINAVVYYNSIMYELNTSTRIKR